MHFVVEEVFSFLELTREGFSVNLFPVNRSYHERKIVNYNKNYRKNAGIQKGLLRHVTFLTKRQKIVQYQGFGERSR